MFAKLPHRGFIKVSGEDARNFLQGIITNDVFAVMPDNPVYACFLTPQGKYLADFFIYQIGDDLVLDVDGGLLPDLLKRLTMYKLRSKVTLEDVSSQYIVTAIWGQEANGFCDPRHPVMGFRVLNADITGEPGDYALWQMQNGIPDVTDFERERTAMLEANLDFLNAISWTKGCYMGQELTARTHYRGLVKKRFLPIELSAAADLEKDTVITRDGKTIGFLRRTYQNWALATIQLEALEQGNECMVGDIAGTIHVPEWFNLKD